MAKYKIKDLATELGISTKTLKNWEKSGKIPKPQNRNIWNWRTYTEEEKNLIIRLVKEKNYFRNEK